MPSFGLTGLSGLAGGLTSGFGDYLNYADQLARRKAGEQAFLDQQQGLELAGQAFQKLFPGAAAGPMGPAQPANLRPPQPGGMPGMTPMPGQASVPGPTAGPPGPPGAQAGGFQGPVPPGGMIPGGGTPISFQVDNQPPQPYPGQPGAPPIPPSPAISPPTPQGGGAVPASQPGAAGPPGGLTPPQGGPHPLGGGMTGLDDAIRAIREANPKASGKQIMQALQFMQPQLNYEGKVELAQMRGELMAAKTQAEFDTKIHQFETSLLRAQIGAQAKTDVAEIAARAGIDKSRISAEAKVTAADQAAWARVESAKVNKDARVEAADLSAWARVEAAKTAGEYKVEAAEKTGAAGIEKAKIGAEAGIKRAEIKAGSALDIANVQANTKEKLAGLTDARIRELATNKQAFDTFMQGLKGENRLEVAKTIGAIRSEQIQATNVSREAIASGAQAIRARGQDITAETQRQGQQSKERLATEAMRLRAEIEAGRMKESQLNREQRASLHAVRMDELKARREQYRERFLPNTQELVKRAESRGWDGQMLADEAEHFRQRNEYSPRVKMLQGQDRAAVTTAINKIAQDQGSTAAERIQNQQKFNAQSKALNAWLNPNSQVAQTTRALSTVQEHFKTARQLIDAWNTQDLPVFNKVAAWFSQQTGGTAAKTIDDVAAIIGTEVIKAMGVRGGGTLEERREMQAKFGVSAPAAKGIYDLALKLTQGQGGATSEQLYATINAMQDLLSGQLKTIKADYEYSTGRKDFEARLGEIAREEMQRIKEGKPPPKNPNPPWQWQGRSTITPTPGSPINIGPRNLNIGLPPLYQGPE